MRIKIPTFVFVLTAVLHISGCSKNEDIVAEPFSIERKVNEARPYNLVYIRSDPSGPTWYFRRNVPPMDPLKDAYAQNGFLVVVKTDTMSIYFELSSAKNIIIEKGAYEGGSGITLYYY